jgi:hypothetical protein
LVSFFFTMMVPSMFPSAAQPQAAPNRRKANKVFE